VLSKEIMDLVGVDKKELTAKRADETSEDI